MADPSRGPSQYFTMCATIFRNENRNEITETFKNFSWNSKGNKHAKALNHFDKVYACQKVSELPVALVGAVSNKLTLEQYLPRARQTPTHYYNKVVHYLLERVGAILSAYEVPREDVRILLEAREQQYGSLLNYLKTIQDNPLHPKAKLLKGLNPFSIRAVKKKDEPCFWVPDIGAHALFCAFRKDIKQHGLVEARYLTELSPVFAAGKSGQILDYGIKVIHSLNDMSADPMVEKTLKELRNNNRIYCKLTK